MDANVALAIMEEGFRRWASVDMGRAQFVLDRDLLRTNEGFYTHRSKLRTFDADDWQEILDPERSWIAATLILHAEESPIVALDIGPRVPGPKREIAPGVSINISTSVSNQPLRMVS